MTNDALHTVTSKGNGQEVAGLRATLEDAMARGGLAMKDLTVLATQNDPFRVDTPAGHRDGQWLAERFAEIGRGQIHLRGLHYAVLGKTKPDGKPYLNDDANWTWLQNRPGKTARWLGYLPFQAITDERNSQPVQRIFKYPKPGWAVDVGNVQIEVPEVIDPCPMLTDFRAAQPYKLVLFGEKTSLEDVLAPIAESRHADLYLPTGEASDTMIHEMARIGAEDGRPMIVFYLSDCDPAGWQMAISVSRKLQGFKAIEFPELDFEVRPIALTPDQVREYGLPSTPLKETEKRKDNWEAKQGVEQTEIDALATLRPDLLRRIVMKATKPFFDAGLAKRTAEAHREWQTRARKALTEEIGEEQLASMRADAEAKLNELTDQVSAINDELHVDEVEGLELPEIPKLPEPEVDGSNGLPSPLIDSDWGFVEQSRRLIAHKNYETPDEFVDSDRA